MLLALAGCTSAPWQSTSPQASAPPEEAGPTVPAGPAWPAEVGHVEVAPSPPFPDTLEGWRLESTWSTTTRVFTDSPGDVAYGPDYEPFPTTMNGCSLSRYLVRWRALNESAQVQATGADSIEGVGDSVTANAGWMDLDGCQVPSFSLASLDDGSTLTDVVIDVQAWAPAA